MKKRFGILLCFSVFFLIPGAKAQEKATPKAGEGISTFLLRHNRSPKKYYNDFVELNRKQLGKEEVLDRKSTRLNSSHANISYAVFCLKNQTQQYVERKLML